MGQFDPDPLPSRLWERIAGILLAVLGLAVAAVAAYTILDPHSRSTAGTPRTTAVTTRTVTTTPSTPQTGTVAPTVTTTASTSERLPLVVLNNTTTAGLAATARDRFVAGGWTVSAIGNFRDSIVSTCAYYDPAAGGAQAAAEALQTQFPSIKRVRPKFAGLPAGPVVVVLTPDYH